MKIIHLKEHFKQFKTASKLAVDSVKIDSYEESACDFDQSQAEE